MRNCIPTVRNVDHFAYTVPDLDSAVTLFGSVFGALPLYRQGPVRDPDGDFMQRQLAVHPRALCRVSMLRLPNANLELLEYCAPGQRADPPTLSDVGGHELAFVVTDLDEAVRWVADQPELIVLPEKNPAAGVGPRRRELCTAWGMPLLLVERELAVVRSDKDDSPDGMPGLLGVARASYTVANLDLALEFLTGPLGGRSVGGSMDGTADYRSVTVRLGPVTDVELRQYRNPGRRNRPRNSDVGGHHIAFYVDNVPAASHYLARLPGVQLLGTPQIIAENGPIDGAHWQYFTGPDGFQFEITYTPPGLPYEAMTAVRKFGPAPAWRPGAD